MTDTETGPPLESEYYPALDAALDTAIRPWLESAGSLNLLFSGGVDSGLLAWELRARRGITLSTVGTRGSPDLRSGEESAKLLSTPWTPAEVTREEVNRIVGRISEDLTGLAATPRSVLVAFAVALDHAAATSVLCGQGVDELFLGYAHFRGLEPEAASTRATSDLRQVLERDWPRAQRIAERLGRSTFAPYLTTGFVRAALAIPIELRLPQPTVKGFFRRWAVHRGLPEAIAFRPKRALQFGSGIDRLIDRPPHRD